MSSEHPQDTYWRNLEEGKLRYQHCSACGNRWLPARTECPHCWSAEWDWRDAAGEGRVVSWVVFHTAFHEAFKDRTPYNVAVVELVEGPRLITNIVDPLKTEDEIIDRRCVLEIQRDHERALPRFRLA